ncbi:PTS fructose transporter subunit IIA [Carnobacterium sp. CS13]|uniref:PTS sugar transporter subunit IIA n=1 Tax=Carnobacterium sp. CS13 TaxID=2800128 RepID=UPI001914D49E|nr:PTS fructose transporter subunit IIA [Carnobacterium sp. CS13]QQP70013.1 PTS fructose transporter subunit IIA [Carnobacterium sp. CS13]
MYKIVVVGHGNYPTGLVSALDLLIGSNENIIPLNLNEERTHEQFEIEITEILKENANVLVFADLTGGAPHQISAKVMIENNFSENQYVISGVTLSLVVELAMKTLFSEVENSEVEENIKDAIAQSSEMMNYLSSGMLKE